jgi:hypothetical protein
MAWAAACNLVCAGGDTWYEANISASISNDQASRAFFEELQCRWGFKHVMQQNWKKRSEAQIHGCPIVGVLHSMKATHRSSRCDENGHKLVAHKLEETVRGTPSDIATAMWMLQKLAMQEWPYTLMPEASTCFLCANSERQTATSSAFGLKLSLRK